jgi:hypothetical protein
MYIRVGKVISDSLKFYIGLSNREKNIKAESVATRMLQLGVTVAEAYATYKEWAYLKEDLKDHTPPRSKAVNPGTRCLRERSASR